MLERLSTQNGDIQNSERKLQKLWHKLGLGGKPIGCYSRLGLTINYLQLNKDVQFVVGDERVQVQDGMIGGVLNFTPFGPTFDSQNQLATVAVAIESLREFFLLQDTLSAIHTQIPAIDMSQALMPEYLFGATSGRMAGFANRLGFSVTEMKGTGIFNKGKQKDQFYVVGRTSDIQEQFETVVGKFMKDPNKPNIFLQRALERDADLYEHIEENLSRQRQELEEQHRQGNMRTARRLSVASGNVTVISFGKAALNANSYEALPPAIVGLVGGAATVYWELARRRLKRHRE